MESLSYKLLFCTTLREYGSRVGLQNIRCVVPAVRGFRAELSYNAFTRHAPKIAYAKASQRWWIHVEFNCDLDLYIFEKAIAGSEIRLVELKDTFYVEDPRIPDAAGMGEASRMAEIIVAQLNGATRIMCPHFLGMRSESLIEILENGTGRGIVSYPVDVHGSSTFPAIESFLKGLSAPINSILEVLKSSADVQEALYNLGAEGNAWANLYKACEVVGDYAGGEKALLQMGFCSRSAWERFRRTANHQEAIGRFSRHARSKAQPPPDPMSVHEAREFTTQLMMRWIQSLLPAAEGGG
jgi:hypothetical protein